MDANRPILLKKITHMMVKVKYRVASLFSSYYHCYVACVLLNEIIVPTDMWKTSKSKMAAKISKFCYMSLKDLKMAHIDLKQLLVSSI